MLGGERGVCTFQWELALIGPDCARNGLGQQPLRTGWLTLSVIPCRWLERHNSKLREGGKKEEKKRLKQFVEDAYKRDPRVIAHTEFKKNER